MSYYYLMSSCALLVLPQSGLSIKMGFALGAVALSMSSRYRAGLEDNLAI